MKTIIYPLTAADEQRLLHVRRIVKKKMKKINVLLSNGRYNTTETTDTKTRKENNMNTYEINDTNTMTEQEAEELFAWLNGKMLKGGE